MRLLTSLAGSAAIHVVADEIVPVHGVMQRFLIEEIADAYEFHARPTLPQNAPMLPIVVWQSGFLMHGDERIVIQQIVMFSDGDAVVAQDTDRATAVLNDLMDRLNQSMGFRFDESRITRLFSSAVSVEFDEAFTRRTRAFDLIRRAVNDIAPRTGHPYELKRMAFGAQSEADPSLAASVRQFVATDFVLERRAGTNLDRPIFFSSAPLPTPEHLAYLERIEREVIAAG